MNDPALHPQSSEQPSALADHPYNASPASPNGATWWRIADFCVLSLWIAVTGFTLTYHEKWADEAQAWLIARDLSLPRIFFYELRYEGSPGLWHLILWIAQHVFHAPYAALGPLGLLKVKARRHLPYFLCPISAAAALALGV